MTTMQAPTDRFDMDLRRRRSRRLWIGGIIAVFAVCLSGFGAYWLLISRYYVSTDDAYVSGNRLTLTPQIAGTVVSIAADDTDLVHAGQPLIELDRSNAEVALSHAEAKLGAAVRKIRKLRQDEDAQQADIALRRVNLEQAQRDYIRDKHLVAMHGVTVKQFQHAKAEYRGAQQQILRAKHHLDALHAQTDAPSLLENPLVQTAVANLHQAWLDLHRTKIFAPATGYVAQRIVQIGERITPSQRLLSIVPLEQVWVDANFKETQLNRLRIGQPVKLTADEYGGNVVYHGRIVGISAGTGSAFELLPPQNATGNWIKIVRRVPVRIGLRPSEVRKHPLRIGLSMAVTVDTHDLRGLTLAAAPRAKVRYHTGVYFRQGKGFSELVDKVLRANGVIGRKIGTGDTATRKVRRPS